jgi:hypothetical protein
MNLQQEVKCDLPGMGDVTVTYNLMATARQVDAFREEATADTAKQVIVKITGLPPATWDIEVETETPEKKKVKSSKSVSSDDPYSEGRPIAWSLWLRWHGWRKAMGQFLTDPN